MHLLIGMTHLLCAELRHRNFPHWHTHPTLLHASRATYSAGWTAKVRLLLTQRTDTDRRSDVTQPRICIIVPPQPRLVAEAVTSYSLSFKQVDDEIACFVTVTIFLMTRLLFSTFIGCSRSYVSYHGKGH